MEGQYAGTAGIVGAAQPFRRNGAGRRNPGKPFSKKTAAEKKQRNNRKKELKILYSNGLTWAGKIPIKKR
jgi:hypothetical protein